MYQWPVEGSLKKIVVSDLKKGDKVNTPVGKCIIEGIDYDESGNIESVDIKKKREDGKGFKYYMFLPEDLKGV